MNKKTLRASVRELAGQPVAASPQAEVAVVQARELTAEQLVAIVGGLRLTNNAVG